MFDCNEFCCGKFDSCTLTCKLRPVKTFVDQVREIGGFEFDNVCLSKSLPVALPTGVHPFIFHGYSRLEPINIELAGLSLFDLVNYSDLRLKYRTADELRSAYQLHSDTRIIISGIGKDEEIERWWRLGEKRLTIIDALKNLRIDLVTAPNYSIVLDVPRFNDLHSLKRILVTSAEFINAGLPCALHTHGRTDHDFMRWGEYLRNNTEISVLAYEFTTGSARVDRVDYHVEQLDTVRRIADRPLSIVVRGSVKCLPGLQNIFESVTYLESNSFMKTTKRQEAYISNQKKLKWKSSHTANGEKLDGLLRDNVVVVKKFVEENSFIAETIAA